VVVDAADLEQDVDLKRRIAEPKDGTAPRPDFRIERRKIDTGGLERLSRERGLRWSGARTHRSQR
jgi:hypothetical protein